MNDLKANETILTSDYRVGQQVYIMDKNKICSAKIFAIRITQSLGDRNIIDTYRAYKLMYPYATKEYQEGEIFATKEELVKHLMED